MAMPRGPQALADDILPLYTSIVRLKSYGKGEQTHSCKKKVSHLLVLTPDALQIFTTADAGAFDEPPLEAAKSAVVASKTGPLSRFIQRRRHGAPKAGSGASVSADSVDDPEQLEELDEGQVFRLGVALNQILQVEVVKADRVKVWYQPNRPSKKGSVEEQTQMVLRSLLKWNTAASASSHLVHRNAHHFTIVAGNAEEAEALKEEVERAQRALALAVLWLSDGLPLRVESTITMVTVGPSTLAEKDRRRESRGGGSSRSSSEESGASSSDGSSPATSVSGGSPRGVVAGAGMRRGGHGGHAFVIPYPHWQEELELPYEVSSALGTPASRRSLSTSVRVHLSTPLGPASAEIPLLSLMQSAAEGSAPVTTVAQLRGAPLEAENSLRPSKQWLIRLQWRAIRGEEEEECGGGSRLQSGGTEMERSSVGVGSRAAAATPRRHRASAATSSGGSMVNLFRVAILSGASAVVRRLRAQLSRLGTPEPGLLGSASQFFKWSLVLLDLEIQEREEQPNRTLRIVNRTLSLSAPAAELAQDEAAFVGLPQHIRLLLAQYPLVLSADIAKRFVVGLGSENKAFAALSAMAQWTTSNKLTDILVRPQPAFAAMKLHYPHGYPGWSKKKDCLVEVEGYGQWPQAYDEIAAIGVTDQAMLEHLLFTYQYAFTKLDARPLPHGKTVKIVDLEGLGMSDLRSPGFKLITRVGSMLSMNFPQRLQRCFLVNAPGWWAVAWKVVSPMIPPKVREQMQLFSKKDKEGARRAMLEWIDEDVLPVAYGGKNVLPREQWPLEKELAAYVATLGAMEEEIES